MRVTLAEIAVTIISRHPERVRLKQIAGKPQEPGAFSFSLLSGHHGSRTLRKKSLGWFNIL